jgi:hypothetical protein
VSNPPHSEAKGFSPLLRVYRRATKLLDASAPEDAAAPEDAVIQI